MYYYGMFSSVVATAALSNFWDSQHSSLTLNQACKRIQKGKHVLLRSTPLCKPMPTLRSHEWVNNNARPITTWNHLHRGENPYNMQHRILRKPGSMKSQPPQYVPWSGCARYLTKNMASVCDKFSAKKFVQWHCYWDIDFLILIVFLRFIFFPHISIFTFWQLNRSSTVKHSTSNQGCGVRGKTSDLSIISAADSGLFKISDTLA